MSILALLSDIHGNLPALEAVLDDARDRAVDGIHHLGDLVGYGPWPDEVVRRIRGEGITGVAGNYDSTVATGYPHCGCRYEDATQEALSHASYGWTREHVDADTARWLERLPFRIDLQPGGGHRPGARVILVHGTPTLNTLYWDENRSDDFSRRMVTKAGARPGDVLAFGHTHRPWRRTVEGVHLVNAGSVGRPKDGDPRACYAVVTLDAERVDVEHVRVAYDVERAAAAIRASELPDALATVLETGGETVVGGAR